MANTKKSTTKKATTKKAAAPKKAATKKVVVKPQADVAIEALALNTPEQNLVNGIAKNQTKIFGQVTSAIKLAVDSGDKLDKLKSIIQTKYGRAWKAWCEAHAIELGISYRQVAKYMLVSQNQQLALDGDFESINDACEAIGRDKRPEAAEKRDTAKAEKRDQAKVTGGQISEKVLNEIDECTDLDQLKGLLTLITERIEELTQEQADAAANPPVEPASEDDLEVPYEEVDDSIDDDIADAIS